MWAYDKPIRYCSSSTAKLQRSLTLKLFPSAVQIKFHYYKFDHQCHLYLTIIPRARMGFEAKAHEAEGRMGY